MLHVLLYHFLFLDKTFNNQNQEGFIICQEQSLDVFATKFVPKNSEISQENTCVGISF